MKIVFMGTPDFAAAQLLALIEAGHSIRCVVTQPDKPKGRKGELTPPEVKLLAARHGLRVEQPESLKGGAIQSLLEECRPDAIVVAAYGKMLPQYVLEYPKFGCINVHASLLPEYRGAAPINWAIINGEEESGVTIMRMDEGMDTGDIILRQAVPITPETDAGALRATLSELGAGLLIKALEQLELGTAKFIKQDECGVTPTYAPKIDNEFCRLNFSQPAYNLERKIYGLAPYPGAFTKFGGKLLKIYAAKAVDYTSLIDEPGTALLKYGGIDAVCGGGALRLLEVQQEGGRRMGCLEFIRGKFRKSTDINGMKFG